MKKELEWIRRQPKARGTKSKARIDNFNVVKKKATSKRVKQELNIDVKMDRIGVGRQGQVIRVVPSIKVLERALLYGVRKLHLGTRVSGIDGKRIINGVAYDSVVVATEAKSVPKVVKNCSDVFDKIIYHPSTIYNPHVEHQLELI